MFGKRLRLFKLFGFQVHIDLSWLVIAALVTWTLAVGIFPQHFPGIAPKIYWIMGAAGALGLFFSIVFHEFAHSLVARQFGIEMSGITLFIFGGVAEMREEPRSPQAEFFMAIAGPLSSVVLAFVFWGVSKWGEPIGWPASVYNALARMNKTQASRLMVTKNDQLVGIVSLKDLLKFLALKVELESGKK